MWITMLDTAAGCVWVRDRLSRESGLRLGKVGYRVSTQHMGAALAGYGAAFLCGAGGGGAWVRAALGRGGVYVLYTSRVSTVLGLIQTEVGLFGFRAVKKYAT